MCAGSDLPFGLVQSRPLLYKARTVLQLGNRCLGSCTGHQDKCSYIYANVFAELTTGKGTPLPPASADQVRFAAERLHRDQEHTGLYLQVGCLAPSLELGIPPVIKKRQRLNQEKTRRSIGNTASLQPEATPFHSNDKLRRTGGDSRKVWQVVKT